MTGGQPTRRDLGEGRRVRGGAEGDSEYRADPGVGEVEAPPEVGGDVSDKNRDEE